ncbi:hypothetical protein CC80DRAFT_30395 [Byssothecium circinans]|uniref:Uncharacterized protein n=1 Tax=Byssothecium circinans TaxID=147558 RepID=A0A6A5TZU4_9PLEO|nr:hypothetical protein CC80DRAFT_30395 [Byssothecium circinans]
MHILHTHALSQQPRVIVLSITITSHHPNPSSADINTSFNVLCILVIKLILMFRLILIYTHEVTPRKKEYGWRHATEENEHTILSKISSALHRTPNRLPLPPNNVLKRSEV